jgi:hypothetical protein
MANSLQKWRTPGNGDGQFGGTIDIALDSKGLCLFC